jgi:hypothetical protein
VTARPPVAKNIPKVEKAKFSFSFQKQAKINPGEKAKI